MTSKEKIELLKDYIWFGCCQEGIDLRESIKELEKDLEILEKYKSIEKELGCPLDVVIKALKDGSCGAVIAFLQNDYNEIYQKGLYKPLIINGLSRECNTNKWCFCCYDSLTYRGYTFYLKNYKKTWWLKEDKLE